MYGKEGDVGPMSGGGRWVGGGGNSISAARKTGEDCKGVSLFPYSSWWHGGEVDWSARSRGRPEQERERFGVPGAGLAVQPVCHLLISCLVCAFGEMKGGKSF